MSIFKILKNYFQFLKIPYENKEFVFYSESKFYRNFFISLINHLTLKKNKQIIFLTSDEDDQLFFKNNKSIKVIYIGKGLIRSFVFINLRCKFMIMTLTDLDNHLKKSKYCKKYIYFFHSPASTHLVYTKEAFKNYDIVLCNGNYHIEELKKTEIKNNYKSKELVKSGYLYFDYLMGEAKHKSSNKNTILFAPSWNYNSKNLFDDYGFKIIDLLLKNDLKVILRPHPEHFKRSKNIINKIKSSFLGDKNFYFDSFYSNLQSMEKSQILITDNSLIAMEFTLVFQRQAIYINYSNKVHNKHYKDLEMITVDEIFRKKFGYTVDAHRIEKISEYCKNIKMYSNLSHDEILNFRQKYFYNFGKASDFIANYLIDKSENMTND